MRNFNTADLGMRKLAAKLAITGQLCRSESSRDVSESLGQKRKMESLRVGVIGYGRMGKMHAANLEALGVQDVKTVDVGDEYPKKGDVDALVISSCSSLHEEHLRVAQQCGGVPVYCEKPLAHTLKASSDCQKLCEASKIPIMLGFQRRFDQIFARIKSEQSEQVNPTRNVLIMSRDPQPPSQEYLKRMGSHFMDMTIHDIDEARLLLDEEPSHVFAHVDSSKMHAFVTMRTPSEKHCQIVNSRHCSFGYDQRVEVFGDNGRAAVDSLPDDPSAFFAERYGEAYKEAIRVFLRDVVLGNKQPPVDAHDAIRAAVIASACERSAQTGMEVRVPQQGEEESAIEQINDTI